MMWVAGSPAILAVMTITFVASFAIVRSCHPSDSLGRVLVLASLATVLLVFALTANR
jgi:hypothetical protein